MFEWGRATAPSGARTIGESTASSWGITFSRPGLLALRHRIGLAYRKPELFNDKLDVATLEVFTAGDVAVLCRLEAS